MITETICLQPERCVTLTAYVLPVGGEFSYIPKRPGVLILPGGGYSMCSDREAEPVALSYLQAGYHAFVLRYSVGAHALWPNPLQDYEQAMELLCNRAEQWGLYADKIAVIGFSAGGHLAACAASVARYRPSAAILGYPAITASTIGICLPSAPDAACLVNVHTCPCFLFASRTDDLVPVQDSLDFLCALQAHGISFESHIYAYGPHGVSIADSSVQSLQTEMPQRTLRWVGDSIAWLRDILGDFGDGKMLSPRCAPYTNADREDFFSVDCSLEYLYRQPECRKLLLTLLPATKEIPSLSFLQNQTKDGAFPPILKGKTLRQLLSYIQAQEEDITRINLLLSRIIK